MLRNTPERYGLVHILFHWVLAICLALLFGFGKYLSSMTIGLSNIHLFNLHKASGLIVLMLVLARLAWRFYTPPPPLLTEGAKPWELRLAHISHVMLYALMLGMPLTGWIASSASGIGITMFGLFNVPLIAPPLEWVEDVFFRLHGLLSSLLVLVVALHVAGALKRHFVLRDMTLRRMWFR